MFVFLSTVTEYEVLIGLDNHFGDPNKHCLSHIRVIGDITDHLSHQVAWRFIDMSGSDIDTEAQNHLINLRDVEIKQKLADDNIRRYVVVAINTFFINKQQKI